VSQFPSFVAASVANKVSMFYRAKFIPAELFLSAINAHRGRAREGGNGLKIVT